jgi:dihydroorotate dehydrogenase electron transfer subunit
VDLEKPEVLEIKSVKEENYKTKTFFFDKKMEAVPGQFIMIWIPRLDEKPFAVSYSDPFGFTVSKRGKYTEKLHELKSGDKIGIRGPYGHGFELKGKKICLVAGGYAVIPVSFLADNAKEKNLDITAIVGSKTKKDLFFIDRLRESCSEVIITTDDGSEGRKGFTTEALNDLLGKENFDQIYTCGPEIMMKKVFDICEQNEIECQASLERFIKCGFGLCGQCCIDDLLVCKDGPVLNSNQLRGLKEFGVFERDKSGSKHYF